MAKGAFTSRTANWHLTVFTAGSGVGTTRSLADWGLQECRLFDGSLQVGTFTATRPTQKIEDAAICAFGDRMRLYDAAGVIRFKGKRVEVQLDGKGPAEHQVYRWANVWWDLQKRVFHQVWTHFVTVGAVSSSSQSYTPHAILNVGKSVEEEVANIILYANSQGVGITLGTIEAPVFPPPDEVKDRDCASIITQLLSYAPDCVCYFDYTDPSTSGVVFHCRRAGSLPAVSVPVGAGPGGPSEALSIRARHEDVATAVAITFERTDQVTVDGVTTDRPVFVRDIYPPTATGREERAVCETIKLTGSAGVFTTARIMCASLPADFEAGTNADTFDFWSRFHPQLKDPRVVKSVPLITPGTFIRVASDLGDADNLEPVVLDDTLPRYLVAGTLAPWMVDASGGELKWQKQDVSAKFNFDQHAITTAILLLDEVVLRTTSLDLPVHLIATNAPAGITTYSKRTAFAEGEQPITGLAEYLYNILSVLGYAGYRDRIQTECDGSLRMGQRLNITGGAVEWATMGALIQSTNEDLDRGETRVSFGVAPGLSLGRIMELMRNARTRRRWTEVEEQEDGTLGASDNGVEFGRVTPDTNSIPGNSVETFYAVKSSTKKVSIDATNRTITIQTFGKPGAVSAVAGDSNAALTITGASGRTGTLAAGVDDVALSLAGGLTGPFARSITLDTTLCIATPMGGTVRGYPITIQAVKSCDQSDPAGSSWIRLVPCSARIRIA